MNEMTLDEIKECSIGVLDYIAKICQDNNLTYYLCGGTLLGAVRHNGFIPWDDDIDIMMPRDDYEKLFSVWPKDCSYGIRYFKNTAIFPIAYGKAYDLRTVKVEKCRSFGTEMGIDVDIFPIDSIPNDDKETVEFFNEIEKIDKRLTIQLSQYIKGLSIHTLLYNIKVFLVRLSELLNITSVKRIVYRFDQLSQKYNSYNTDYCGITSISHYGAKEKNNRSVYNEVVNVSFEGKSYPAPIGYKDYLSHLYGVDYMALPPKSKRVTHHSYKAFWK